MTADTNLSVRLRIRGQLPDEAVSHYIRRLHVERFEAAAVIEAARVFPPVPERYGDRRVPKMYAQINTLRAAIRAEGTPAIQSAWDAVEKHIDFAYGQNRGGE